MPKIIGIVGSRSRNSNRDFLAVHKAFLEIYEEGDWICSGGCPQGGDRFAYRLHQDYVTPYLEFPAFWEKHGKVAGFLRNTDIAKASDVLLACVSEHRVGGTEDTIKKFVDFHGEEGLYIV